MCGIYGGKEFLLFEGTNGDVASTHGGDEGGWTVPLICLPDFFDDGYLPPDDGRS